MSPYQRAVAEMAAKIEAELERQADEDSGLAPYVGPSPYDEPYLRVDGSINLLALAAACLPQEEFS